MLQQRIKTKSSQTAAYTCFSRGCATREKDPRFRGPDDMAELLFPLAARVMLNVAPLRKLIIQKMIPPGLHEYVFARTKVMDAAFAEALDAHFPQIILLGAGFDTRALRFASRNQGTKIIELDAPTTQQAKLGVLRRKKIPLPAELVFASINFDQEELSAALENAGYQAGQCSLFLWEGVTMYLSAQAVDKTLDFIRDSSASGSRVAFDYLYAAVIRKENRYYGEQKGSDMVAGAGESWIFGLEEGEIASFLAQRGFDIETHYTPLELEKRYLTREDGTLYRRINGTHCIVIASIR